MSEPVLIQMIDDIDQVINKYRKTLGISYSEAIGALEIIKLDIYSELIGDNNEEINL